MPTLLSHAAVPLAIGLGLGRSTVSRRLLAAGVAASMLPDFDVAAFKFGIAYADAFGHRGASHSLLFAALLALAGAAAARPFRASWPVALLFVGLSAASHPLLDMLTKARRGAVLAVVGAAVFRAVAGHRGVAHRRAPDLQRTRTGGVAVGIGVGLAAGGRGMRLHRPGSQRPKESS